MLRLRPILVFGIAAVATIAARPSFALCPPPPQWELKHAVTRPVPNTPSGPPLTFYSYGGTLRAVWSESGATPVPHVAGETKWTWSAPGATTITNFPNPVVLSNGGGEFIFFGGSDGFLYKLNTSTGTFPMAVDTRRGGCLADQIVATPAVQLYANSNPPFQSAILGSLGYADDLVFVITKTGCGDDNSNRIIAYYASDLTERWVYNDPVVQPMGYGSEECAVNYINNLIYCGTKLDPPAVKSVWAVNTITGGLQWSSNAGSVLNRPQLGQNKLYVVSKPGTITRFDPVSGAVIWNTPAAGGIARDVWVEFRAPLANRILYVDAAGALHYYEDTGASAVPLWPPLDPGGGVKFTGMPVVLPGSSNRAYVGRDDGKMQEVDLSTPLAGVVSPPITGTPWDPSLDSSIPFGTPDRLIVASTDGSLRRYCVPWSEGTVAVDEASFVPMGLVAAPNPSAGSARFEYALPSAASVEIEIYNVAGQRVRALARLDLPAGRHQLVWDGRDDSGRPAANGIYLCRMRAQAGGEAPLEQVAKVEILR